jgi:hypothetical protein
MSDTKRKTVKYTDTGAKVINTDDRTNTMLKYQHKEKKLKPYIRDDVPCKEKATRGTHYVGSIKMANNSVGAKTEVANINRNMKKGKRQALKKELKNELNSE